MYVWTVRCVDGEDVCRDNWIKWQTCKNLLRGVAASVVSWAPALVPKEQDL